MLGVVVVVGVLSVAACAGNGESEDDAVGPGSSTISESATHDSQADVALGGSPDPSTVQTSSIGPGGAAPDELASLRLLALIPADSTYSSFLTYADLKGAQQQAQLEELTRSSGDAFRDGWSQLTVERRDEATGRVLPQVFSGSRVWATAARYGTGVYLDFGFWMDDVSTVVSTHGGLLDESAIDLYDLTSQPEAIDAAVTGEPVWAEVLERSEYADLDYYNWPSRPDGGAAVTVTPMRPNGQGGQLAVVDGVAVRTLLEPAMHSVAETRAGGPAVADDPAVREIVRLLDEANSYQFVLIRPDGVAGGMRADARFIAGGVASAAGVQRVQDAIDAAPDLLVAYEWIGFGVFYEDGVRVTRVVLAHDDERAALENVERFKSFVADGTSYSMVSGEPWSRFIEIVEIEAAGRLTVAKLRIVSGDDSVDDSFSVFDLFLRSIDRRDLLLLIDP